MASMTACYVSVHLSNGDILAFPVSPKGTVELPLPGCDDRSIINRNWPDSYRALRMFETMGLAVPDVSPFMEG